MSLDLSQQDVDRELAVDFVRAQKVTRLLQRWRDGSGSARDELMAMVHGDLRKIATRLLSAERPGHTLPATALVHEAFFRPAGADVASQSRAHFYTIAARIVRRVLVELPPSHPDRIAAEVRLGEVLTAEGNMDSVSPLLVTSR